MRLERISRKIKRRLRSQKGVTLVEMLCAVLVLGLLGLLLNTGIMMAVRNYHAITAASEVQILLSTLTDALIDDLRYARDVQVDVNNVLQSYASDSYGSNTSFSLDDGQLLAAGQRVLPPGAYRNGKYEAALPDIKYEDGCFKVALSVQEKDGGGMSAETEFSIYCLNSAVTP